MWSVFVTLILLVGLGGWQQHELTKTRIQTAAVIDVLQEENNAQAETLKQLKEELDATKTETQTAITETKESLKQNIDQVETRAQQSVQSLSGELATVKQTNEDKISELEQQLQVNLRSGDFSGLIQDVIKSVVSVRTDKSVGSGVFVTGDGYIVTNHHVIKDASAGAVKTFDGQQLAVRIVGFNAAKDIAVLKVDGNFPRLKFGDSDNIDVGQRVIALGSPAGLEFSVNEGIISAKRDMNNNEYFQTDVALNPGNSGGPLVDAKGKIIGINNFKLQGYEGLNFAITSNDVRDIVDDFIAQDGG